MTKENLIKPIDPQRLARFAPKSNEPIVRTRHKISDIAWGVFWGITAWTVIGGIVGWLLLGM